MTSADEKDSALRSRSFEELESPFLDHELGTGGESREWEGRLDTLEEEDAFRNAFEQPWTGGPQFELEEQGVIGTDNRVRVKDTTAVPWRWICKIRIDDSRGREVGSGTGLLVSNRHVLTAAHVIYDAYKNMQQYTITVTPALNDLDEPFDHYVVTAKPKIRKDYSSGVDDYDYALLNLVKSVGEKEFKALKGNALCYWASPVCGANTVFARMDPHALNGRAAYTAGYPSGKGGKQLWCAAGILHSVNERRRTMWTTADTTKGQSGSPVWVTDNKKYCLVGVAVGAGTSSNVVVRVTRELVRQLRAWITEDGETPAMIETEEAYEPSVPSLGGQEAEVQAQAPNALAELYEEPEVVPGELDEEAAQPEWEYDIPTGVQPADAFVADKYGKAYFTMFSVLGDLSIQTVTILKPARFEHLIDSLLASKQKNFVIDAHGDPNGLTMHLAEGTTMSATKQALFMLWGIERIRFMMQAAKESNTIWDRASGSDLDRWQKIVKSIHTKAWRDMVGKDWPAAAPQAADVDSAKRLLEWRINALVDALFPGAVSGKHDRADRLVKKMLQLQAKGIREIQFRACNIGKSPSSLDVFRKFFGADYLCAPDVRTGMGPTKLLVGRGEVEGLAKNRSTQVYELSGGKFAILVEFFDSTFNATCAAETQAVAGEWVAAHLMPNSRYREGPFPIHVLQTDPVFFALDEKYASHIQCTSSLLEATARAQEVEEAEIYADESEKVSPREEEEEQTSVFDSREAGSEAETEEQAEEAQIAFGPDTASEEPAEVWAGESPYDESLFERQLGGTVSVVDPFPKLAYSLPLQMSDEKFIQCCSTVEADELTKPMCGAVADLTGNPAMPIFYGHNPVDMLYVGSMAKIYTLYVAFELRKRVQEQAKDMIKLGLSPSTPGWERDVYASLRKAWKPIFKKRFSTLPEQMPSFEDIFVLTPSGEAKFAEQPLSDADLDRSQPNPKPDKPPIKPEFKTPEGKFLEWMRLMLRWSNNDAASLVIRALSYPYLNGVLTTAGFFDPKTRTGLWISGDYANHDWLTLNAAGQPLTPRWAKLQGRTKSNFTGTAFQVARLMMFIARSSEMVKLMTGVHGIGSYVKSALPVGPHDVLNVASKIGCGDERPGCGFSHDCAIVRYEQDNSLKKMRYVAVALGSHPDRNRTDLRKMVTSFHACIAARNGW
jgi:V8-like Glu-specific endopeptidase